mgnify:FL=1
MALGYLANTTKAFGINERNKSRTDIMFTIEMDWDETAITILDPKANFEDLQVIMYDDIVYIRQWENNIDGHNYIAVSPGMMLALQAAFKLPVGAYNVTNSDGEIE